MKIENKTYQKLTLSGTLSIPQIITVHCYDMAPDYIFDRVEEFDFWEMFYVDRGQIMVTHSNKTETVGEGEALFLPPMEPHTLRCDGIHAASVFIITFVCRSGAMKSFADLRYRVRGDISFQMQRLIEECERVLVLSSHPLRLRTDAPVGGLQMIRMYLETMLISVIRERESEKKAIAEGIACRRRSKIDTERIAEYLQSRVMDNVTIDEVVKRFSYAKSTLCHAFVEDYGVPMMKYHGNLKIEEAKRMLREDKMTVSEVSECLSFETPEYFSRVFRAAVGMPPTAFKKALISTKKLTLSGKRC